MKYVVAIISGLVIFVLSFIVVGLVSAMVLPEKLRDIEIELGLLSTNLPSLIAFILASLAATHTFRVSLRSKTGKLYIKTRNQE